MANVKMRNHIVVVHQGVHILEAWFPREVRMVPPTRIICATVLGIDWWLVLAHIIGLFSHHIPH